ncbi:MAG: response regulator [Paracoccaceae bacterium]
MKCLIVEDEVLIRMELVLSLQDLGHSCLEADSVADASYLMKTHDFDVILLDLHVKDGQTLPLVDYLAVMGTKAIVVLITGSGAFPNGESVTLSPRIDFVLRKPVNLPDLVALLEYSVTCEKVNT